MEFGKALSRFCAVLMIVALLGVAGMGARGYVQTATGTAGTSATCTFAHTPSQGDVLYMHLHLNHNAATTVTTPTGTWTQIDALTDSSNQDDINWWHVVTAADGTGYTFTWTTSFVFGLACYDLGGVNTTTPIGAHNMSTFASTLTPTTATVSDASNSGDFPIGQFAHTSNANCPSSIQSGWTRDSCGNNGVGLVPTTAHGPNTTATSQNVSFTATWATAFAGISAIVLFAPAPGSQVSLLQQTLAGGNLLVTTTAPAPNIPAPIIAKYAPSYMYFGNSSGGGGGNICNSSPVTYCSGNTTTACGTMVGNQCAAGSTGAVLTAAGVRYAEMGNQQYNTGFDPFGACPNPNNDNTSCKSLSYDDLYLPSCALSSGPEVDFLKATQSAASDATYQHILGDSHIPANRFVYASVTCGGVSTTPANSRIMTNILDTGTVSNDAAGTSDARPAALTTWYHNAGRINNDCPSRGTFEDNMFTRTTDEFQGGNATQVTNFVTAAAKWFNYFSPCKTVPNYEPGGGLLRNSLSGAFMANGCVNWSCQDAASFCANVGTGAWGVVGERWLASAGTAGGLNWGDATSPPNIVFEINTASIFFASTGCRGMDFIALDSPAGSGADSHPNRDLFLATRMLLTPGTYTGAQTDATFISWLYTESGSIAQTPVYVEDGLNFVPINGYAPWNPGGTPPTDGNGCNGTGFSGGVAALKVACTGLDSVGGVGAVYGRNGECYKFGTDIGKCTVLINESNAAVAIQASWCTPACNTYPDVFNYIGVGPETCLDDSGTSLGTGSATCTDGAHTLNVAANGAQSAWGESTSFNGTALPGLPSLPACASEPTVNTSECAVVFLSQ